MKLPQAIENVKAQIASLKVQLEAESVQHRHFYSKYVKLIDAEKFEEAALCKHFAEGQARMAALEKEIKALELIVKVAESFDPKYYYEWLKNKQEIDYQKYQKKKHDDYYTQIKQNYINLEPVYTNFIREKPPLHMDLQNYINKIDYITKKVLLAPEKLNEPEKKTNDPPKKDD